MTAYAIAGALATAAALTWTLADARRILTRPARRTRAKRHTRRLLAQARRAREDRGYAELRGRAPVNLPRSFTWRKP